MADRSFVIPGSIDLNLEKAMPSVIFYMPSFASGGIELQYLRMAPALIAAGYSVTFVVHKADGSLVGSVPSKVHVHVLNTTSSLKSIWPLARYLRSVAPDILIGNMPHQNLVSIAAKYLVKSKTKVIATHHNHFSKQVNDRKDDIWYKILPVLYRIFLKHANAIVAVSNGVADDLARVANIKRSSIVVIHNPAVPSNIRALASNDKMESNYVDGEPFIIAIGRLVKQKDFSTLLRAVAQLNGTRLLVLGEGPLLNQLQAEAESLGIGNSTKFGGFEPNPYPYLSRARVLALSSIYEGFGNVIAEALALGIPVVSTNCMSGPSEILQDGRYGKLVPVGDENAMAKALAHALVSRPPEGLESRGMKFTVDEVAPKYVELMNNLLSAKRPVSRFKLVGHSSNCSDSIT